MDRVKVPGSGFRQIVYQAHADQFEGIDSGFYLCQHVGNECRTEGMLRYGFLTRAQEMESGPRYFFEHPGFEKQIGDVFHINSLPG
jgi:hypothetical protein